MGLYNLCKALKSNVCFILSHFSNQAGHSPNAQWSRVVNGYHVGHCGPAHWSEESQYGKINKDEEDISSAFSLNILSVVKFWFQSLRSEELFWL